MTELPEIEVEANVQRDYEIETVTLVPSTQTNVVSIDRVIMVSVEWGDARAVVKLDQYHTIRSVAYANAEIQVETLESQLRVVLTKGDERVGIYVSFERPIVEITWQKGAKLKRVERLLAVKSEA